MEYIRTILLVGCRDNRNITITGSEGGSWPLNNIYRTEPVDSVNHQNNSDGEPILRTDYCNQGGGDNFTGDFTSSTRDIDSYRTCSTTN